MKEETFEKGMALFLATFSNIKIKKNTLDVWFELLKDIPDKLFEIAIGKICREVKDFYPTTNFVALVREQITAKIEDRAILAWDKVVEGIRTASIYGSVQFDDSIIHSVIDSMGGWDKFCIDAREDCTWLKKDFERLYGVYDRTPEKEHPKYLPGLCEKQNSFNAYDEHIKSPVQIGKIEEIKKIKGKE